MAGPALTATSLQVSITVNDLQKSLRFYVDGLGFVAGDKHEANGKLMYVSLSAGGASIGIAQDDFAKGRDRVKGVGLRLFIGTSQDVTALAARAKAAGIKLDGDPAPLPWGPMAFALTDPDGFKITISNER